MNAGIQITVGLHFRNNKVYSTAEFKNVWNFPPPASLMRFHGLLHKHREGSEELLAFKMTVPGTKTR
jgi:hypothetical protein